MGQEPDNAPSLEPSDRFEVAPAIVGSISALIAIFCAILGGLLISLGRGTGVPLLAVSALAFGVALARRTFFADRRANPLEEGPLVRVSNYPRPRLFQFRLGAWFVLIGIAAWAMAVWPHSAFQYFAHAAPGPLPGDLLHISLMRGGRIHSLGINLDEMRVLLFPCLALALFLASRLVWRLVERLRSRRNA